jgi:hypothetical protein
MHRTIFSILLFVSLLQPVLAQTEDKWNYSLAFPMIWAPGIEGTIEGGGERIDFTIPFGDIVEKLNVGFMGEFFAEKGNWSYGIKLNYLHATGESISDPVIRDGVLGPIVIAPAHEITNDFTLSVNDLLAGYRVHDKVRLYGGIRYLYTKIDLKIRPQDNGGLINISRDINIAEEKIFDGIIGAQFRHNFSDRWKFTISGDVGLIGDNDRDYMLEASFIYRISKLNNIALGYRYLMIGNDITAETDLGPVDYTLDFVEQGPMLGWVFTF